LLVDPVFEQINRDLALINELNLCLLWTLETHAHADPVTSAGYYGLSKESLSNHHKRYRKVGRSAPE
jgi:hypothetical protein